MAVTRFGKWVERLEALAVGREVIAVAGRRDIVAAPAKADLASHVHVLPVAALDGKGESWSLVAGGAIRALAFAGDALLLGGGDDGALIAWDVTGKEPVARLALGASVRALAVDNEVARGGAGSLAVGTADGALHVIALAIRDAKPTFTVVARHALSDGAITAAAWDPAGLWVAGGADGQLWAIGAAVRAIAPGGDGGVRAIVCIGDGRAAIGCGDGSVRLCFLVGDVEASDRSGDHGHTGAVRGLALGPAIVDDAGRDLPRRLFSVGEDGALKAWFVDGARRPRTIELGIGAATALAFAPGPVIKPVAVDKAAGRLWIASAARSVAALALGPEVDPVGDPIVVGSLIDSLRLQLGDGKVAVKVKLAAVETLTHLAEDDARELLDLALAGGPTEVSVAATRAMVRSERRASRPELRTALTEEPAELRAAAFAALLALEAEQPLIAIRAGLASKRDDVRVLAVAALVPLAPSSVIAAGLIAEALKDSGPTVRQRAYAALREIARSPAEAIRTALARGASDVRAEALLDLAFAVRDTSAAARALTAGAFDDDDGRVRSAAFLASVAQQPAVAARLAASAPGATGTGAAASRLALVDASLAEWFASLVQQHKLTLPADSARALGDDELEPLFAQLACRHGDAAMRGAGCLLAVGDRRAVGAVLQLTREADASLRRAATANLVRALAAWPDEERLATRLSWLLDDPDAQVRSFAFDALARAATTPAAELELAGTALRTSQEDIRVRALQILVRIGAPGSAVHDSADALLGDALDDEASKVRLEAFRTLQTWHAKDANASLARGAHSRHADLRTLVVGEIDRRRQAKQSNAALDRLLLERVGDAVGAVGLAAYAALTRQPDDGREVAIAAEVHLAAMASPVPAVRAAGAKGAAKAAPGAVRARLIALIKDDHPEVHLAAIEALDAVAPDDAEGFALAFASVFYALQVRAVELCGQRRDPRAIAPAQRLLSIAKTDLNRPADGLRQRAARALADVGDPSTIAFLRGLIDDEDVIVREMAARGLATAAQPGPEADNAGLAALVALLGHAELPVRSWAAEGLAKLGDPRALPVLAGTQRHDHRPLRIGAIVGLVALGPDGVRGLRQGLEDSDREIADLAFAVIVARDAALAAAGLAPDLLVDAMSSPSPEIRFAAARLYERRARGELVSADVLGELVGPRVPEKATDAKDWPAPPRRAALLQVVADAIASPEPGRRYAATQVLALRRQPLTFWREAARLAGPSASAPRPHTNWSVESRAGRRSGWLRRLVGERRDPEATELESVARMFLRAGAPATGDVAAAQRLVFGVYAGLIRQAPARGAADETHRVRRDAVARLVELAHDDAVGGDAVIPVLGHAVGDPHHLVRQAALAALRSLYPVGALAPLQLAIASAADLGKAALDELVDLALNGDDRARDLVRSALDADDAAVRAHAAKRLPRLYPIGSVEPQLVAAQSRHSDLRLGAVTQLAAADTQLPPGSPASLAIGQALISALGSEHSDLRLRAAVALARRGDALGVEVLGAFLRSDDDGYEALEALVGLAKTPGARPGSNTEPHVPSASAGAAAEVIAARLDELRAKPLDDVEGPDLDALRDALASLAHPLGAPALVRWLVELPLETLEKLRTQPFEMAEALLDILRAGQVTRNLPDGRHRFRLLDDLAITHYSDVARSPLPGLRVEAAKQLGAVDARGAEDVLARMLADREPEVRVAAAESLALRAEYVADATLAPLEAALRGGRRELVLPAALGLAARKRPEAFQPLLLVTKAGEPDEQDRALLALGSLGDPRALAHLLPLLDPAPDDEAARARMPAAVEALGRLLPALTGDEATQVREKLERLATASTGPVKLRALTGLRYAGLLAPLEAVASDREAEYQTRTHALEELGRAASPSSEPVLAALLAEDNATIQRHAYKALGRVLGGDRTRLNLYAVGSPRDSISEPAARFLAIAGDPATLVERLPTIRSAEVRAMLRDGLVRREALPRPAVDAVLAGDAPVPVAEASWLIGGAGAAALPLAGAVEAAVGRAAAWLPTASAPGVAQASAQDALLASLWAARRVGAASAAKVEATAQSAVKAPRAPVAVRREAASVLAAGSPAGLGALANVVGDADREVRATAANALAARQAQAAEATVRALGSRADATTIAPLALAAWPQLVGETTAEPSTRAWSLTVSLIGRRADELIAIARKRGDAGRLAAIAALGRLGGDAAVAALRAIHADKKEDDEVRLAAWKALRRASRVKKVYAEGQDKGPRGGDAVSGAGESDDDDASDDDDSDGDSDGDDSDDDDDESDDDESDDDDSDDDASDDDDESDDDDDESDDDDDESDDDDDESDDDDDSDDDDSDDDSDDDAESDDDDEDEDEEDDDE